jgi:anhydro-N-acetylmuramic acid kinase
MITSYREKKTRLVAGVMSGTSLDGIDVAFVEIAGSGEGLRHSLRGYREAPIDPIMRGRLLSLSAGEMPVREAFELDADLGRLYADVIAAAAEEEGIPLTALDAVGLHGQTVYHAPRRSPAGVTVQIGSAAAVVERLRTIVVNDFRTADVAAGGEGAPLVPYCDFVLLRSPGVSRVALNIGGIANVTWLPRDASLDSLVAFDTGPGNMLIDAAMRHIHGLDLDEGGAHAAAGTPDERWVARLLDDEYYAWPPPKSAGRERFGEDVGRALAAEGLSMRISPDDIIATLTLLTARSIAEGVRRHAARGTEVDEMIVGGGGSRNRTMMAMLASELPGTRVMPSDEAGLPASAKEAICFAILANEALMEERANVISVTGAGRPVICGAIRLP